MSETDLLPLVEALAQARVLCVGDVMLDHYVYGAVERVSPEAPIPVLRVDREERTLGGAGNVVRNLHALGLRPCFVSVTGNDAAGREVGQLMARLGGTEAHVLSDRSRTTTLKTRYVAGTQQMLRADREQAAPLAGTLRQDFLAMVRQLLPQHQVLIVSDYAKGVLADGVAAEIIGAARAMGLAVVVDPKGSDYQAYRGASVIKLSSFPKPREAKAPPGGPFEAGGIRYFTISVPDLRSLVARLESHGVKPFMPIRDIGGGMTVAMVSDPDGNTVELLQTA